MPSLSRPAAFDPRDRYPTIVIWPDDPAARMEFVPIPPGEFLMGSRDGRSNEEPRHLVRIPAPRDEKGREIEDLPAFWMARTPVTQAQFQRWREGPRREYGERGGPDALPATGMSWDEAAGFCEWLGETEALALGLGVPTGGGSAWRAQPVLPSEVEWEYACRAGSGTEYANGDGEGVLDEMGWYRSNSGGTAHPVGRKTPNAWGLYDMHGSVWEWCRDGWDEGAYRGRMDGDEAQETLGGSTGLRVVRGGSWFDFPWWCRSAFRGWRLRGGRLDGLGFQGFRPVLLRGPVGQAKPRGARRRLGRALEREAGRRPARRRPRPPPPASP